MSAKKSKNQLNEEPIEQDPGNFELKEIEKEAENPKMQEVVVETALQRQIQKLEEEADKIYSQYQADKILSNVSEKVPLPPIPTVLDIAQIRIRRQAEQNAIANLADKLAYFISNKSEMKGKIKDLKYYFSTELIPIEIKSETVDLNDIEKTIQKYEDEGYQLIAREKLYSNDQWHLKFSKEIKLTAEHEKNLKLLAESANDPIEVIERLKIIFKPEEESAQGKQSELAVWLGEFLNEKYMLEPALSQPSINFNNPNLREVLSFLNQIGFKADKKENLYYSDNICQVEIFEKINDQKITEILEIQDKTQNKLRIRGIKYILQKDNFDDPKNELFTSLLKEKGQYAALENIQRFKASGLLKLVEEMVSADIYYTDKIFLQTNEFRLERQSEGLKETSDSSIIREIKENRNLFDLAKKLNILIGCRIDPNSQEDLEVLKDLSARAETIAVAVALKTVNVTSLEQYNYNSLKNLKTLLDDPEVVEYLLSNDTLDYLSAFREKYQHEFKYKEVKSMFGGHTKYEKTDGVSRTVDPYGLAKITTSPFRGELLSDKMVEIYQQLQKHFNYKFSTYDIYDLMQINQESEKWKQIFINAEFISMIKNCFSGLYLKNLKSASLIEFGMVPTIIKLHEFFDYKIHENFNPELLKKNQEKFEQLYDPSRQIMTQKLGILFSASEVWKSGQYRFVLQNIDDYLEFPVEYLPLIDVLEKYPAREGISKDNLLNSLKQLIPFDPELIEEKIKELNSLIGEIYYSQHSTKEQKENFRFDCSNKNLKILVDWLENNLNQDSFNKLKALHKRQFAGVLENSEDSKDEETKATSETLFNLKPMIKFLENEDKLADLYREISSYEKFTSFNLDPHDLDKFNIIIDSGLLDNLRDNAGNKQLQQTIFTNYEQLAKIESNKRLDYIKAINQINDSPSQEMQRLKNSLLRQIMDTENPLETLSRVEQIFIKNNLPLVGKIYKIFEILHPPEILKEEIERAFSPTLKRQKNRSALRTIFTDLINIHIGSGNRSLRNYLEIMAFGEKIIKQAEDQGFENLIPEQRAVLKAFFTKLETLFENSQLGQHQTKPKIDVDLQKSYQNLRESLKAKSGQKITERVTDMFLRPIGAKDIHSILEKMKAAKSLASQRNLNSAIAAEDGHLELNEGDLMKGVDIQYLENILQNGSVSKEFLSGLADSDLTPLDTDLSMVLPEDILVESEKYERFDYTYKQSIAPGYGKAILVIKNRGQYELEQGKKPIGELFPTKVIDKRHYGVRTGISSTEIDFIILKANEKEEDQKIFFEIAKNGFYIPVTDIHGEILFTPEQYHELRKTFSGLERFDGDPLIAKKAKKGDINFSDISKIKRQNAKREKKTALTSFAITKTIENLFNELNINFKQKFDSGILGARLEDIGSTGRGTNIDEASDFDLSLLLDARDFPRAAELAKAFISRCRYKSDNSHSDREGYFQLRLVGVSAIGKEIIDPPIDLDIGFAKNSELEVFSSHEAVKEKLEFIGQNQGESFKQEAIANIILAKKVLKAGGVYKKFEENGLGGIGVETWILQHSGNFLEAVESFLNAAKTAKTVRSFEKFKEKYKIFDPGINIKKKRHDDFVRNLSESSYRKMVGILSDYIEGKLKIKLN